MPRSVTKIVLAVGVPLVTLATVGIVGPHPASKKPEVASSRLAMRPVGSRHAGPNDLRLLEAEAPSPTATPVAAQAPAASRPAAAPAPVAVRPAPVAPRPKAPAPPPVSSVGGAAGAEFSLVNQDRRANGVAALAWSSALARVAQYRAQDMLNRNYFSHYDPATGQLAFVQLLHLWGIGYTTAGENIAWSTNPSMANINTMFMNSPEHRANILKAAYHRVGIGVASNGAKTMVVEVFSN
jgi:uncharacterized protein YkwD